MKAAEDGLQPVAAKAVEVAAGHTHELCRLQMDRWLRWAIGQGCMVDAQAESYAALCLHG